MLKSRGFFWGGGLVFFFCITHYLNFLSKTYFAGDILFKPSYMVEVEVKKKYLKFQIKNLDFSISVPSHHLIATFVKESTSALCQCLEFLKRIFPFKFNNIFLLNINPPGADPDFFFNLLRGLRRKGGVKVVEILHIYITQK